jgi:hypothetical protein
MDYLQTYRQSLERDRLENILTGLNSFVQGQDSADPINESLSRTPSSSELERSRTPSPIRLATSGRDSDKTQLINKLARLQAKPEDNPRLTSDSTLSTSSYQKTSPEQSGTSTDRPKTKHSILFQRAAQLMQRSLDLGEDGGVVIFDSNATPGIDSDEGSTETSSVSVPLAEICALSTKQTNTAGCEGQRNSLPIFQMDRSFFRRILRRFGKGAIWYFHQDGTLFSSDDDTSKSESEDTENTSSRNPNMSQPRLQRVLREKDLRILRNYFPDATRIIFTPLWDSLKSQWFGGCFCWSSAETRIFSDHVELGGVFGFGSSLMMEHSRMKSQEADKKKADFISNISWVFK